jgi:hypothetical protein
VVGTLEVLLGFGFGIVINLSRDRFLQFVKPVSTVVAATVGRWLSPTNVVNWVKTESIPDGSGGNDWSSSPPIQMAANRLKIVP